MECVLGEAFQGECKQQCYSDICHKPEYYLLQVSVSVSADTVSLGFCKNGAKSQGVNAHTHIVVTVMRSN